MDFIESIQNLSNRIKKQHQLIQTEEATKQSFIIPLIGLLGYDIYDPTEVIPEYTADFGFKKGEKADYAIIQNQEPIMIFECKKCGDDLDIKHESQLFRYFTATKTRIGVLTNGIVYKFFTDLEKSNNMDEKPFLEIDLLNLHEPLVSELNKFSKEKFNLDSMLSTANELKYTKEIKKILQNQLVEADPDLVRFLASKVYSGRIMQGVIDQFNPLVVRSFKEFLNEEMSKRFKSVLNKDSNPETTSTVKTETVVDTEKDDSLNRINTTEEELEGYYIVKSILNSMTVFDIDRVAYRDTISYFGILLDDNNRKPVCRLHFNTAKKYITIFDTEDKKGEKILLSSLKDIYNYTDRIQKIITTYDNLLELETNP